MSVHPKYLADLTEGGIYHIFNRTNNKERLFQNDENRKFFLKKFEQYLSPLLETYCWSLLPNHFHFLNRVKRRSEISEWLVKQEILKPAEKKYLNNEINASTLIERAFQQFFTSYAMAFNRMFDRSGNLFHRPFKRLAIEQDSHFTNAVIYIHANPQKHGLIRDFRDYSWSSWNEIISDRPSQLLRSELFDWFGGKDNFILAHLECNNLYDSMISIER